MGRMNRTEVFQILGLDETKDEGQIKNAYRQRLAVTNPEDDPEGFKRLRRAYEEACRLAEESDDTQEKQPEDTTPSGQWVKRAAEIYQNIHTRQNLTLWKELFAADCFLSLEDEENCRFKLLRFLTEHFKLPTDVWKLLDKKLSLVHDAPKLREQFPADFIRYILNKCEHGEDVEFSQFRGPEEGDYDLFLQYYDRTWQALAENKTEEAARNIECADQLDISHPVLEICRGDLLNRQGKTAEALALMEGLLEKYPKDAMVAYNAAELLWKQEQAENGRYRKRAAGIFQELKKETDSHYMANVRLAEWYYETGQYRDAKKCAEKVLTSGSDDAFMDLLIRINAEIEKELEQEYDRSGNWEPALELCWCYLQDGKISRGIRLAVDLEKQLPPEKEAEFDGLMAKLFVEEAEYEDSVIMAYAWEEALHKKLESDETAEERDYDRLKQACMIRMQCYYNLGFQNRDYFEKALEEGRKALTDSRKDAAVLLEQAHILIEMEEYEQCLELADKLIEEYQIYAAYAIFLEVSRRQLDAAGVIRSSGQCIRHFPGFVKAYEYVAKVYLDLNYREDLEKILEDAEKNGVKSEILNAYRYQLSHEIMDPSVLGNKLRHFRDKYRNRVERGEAALYRDGLKLLTEYLYQYPDSYMFVERGLFHKSAHHYREAEEDFEKALALEPANSYALNGLSSVRRMTGDYEKALFYLKKAALYREKELSSVIYEDMGNLYSLLGDYQRALAAHLQAVEPGGNKNRSRQGFAGLAECRLRLGQTEAADEIYRQIYENDALRCWQRRVELYAISGDEKKAEELLTAWRKNLNLEREGLVSRCVRRVKYKGKKQEYCHYYKQAAWLELLYGSRKKALGYFEEMLAYNTESWREYDFLGDMIFGCIVCGDDRRGRKYSERLGMLLDKEASKVQDGLFNQGRRKLYFKVLSRFFESSPGAVWELLDQGNSTEICHSCTSPHCKELEAARILYLYRQGKIKEAKERLKSSLERLSQDQYMLAVRHMVFGDL